MSKKTTPGAQSPAQIVPRKLSELPHPDRPALRKYSEDVISRHIRHIERFGARVPLIVHGGQLLDALEGFARYAAFERMQVLEVPTLDLSDMPLTDARAWALAEYRLPELAEWNWSALQSEFVALEADIDLDFTGFDAGARQGVREKAAQEAFDANPDEHEDDIPEITGYPVSTYGDLWELGGHRIICGDSFDEISQETLRQGDQIHLVVTDPPYAVYGSSTGIAADIADDKMVRPFFEKVVRLVNDALPWFGHAYLFTDWRSWSALWEASRQVSSMAIKNKIIWDKGGAGLGSNYANTYEEIAFLHKLPPQKAMGSRAAGIRSVHRPNIMRHNRVTGDDRHHNAAKPVALLRDIVENSSGPGDVVLDCFLGSGSTLLAAEGTGRQCLGSEMEPKWIDVTIYRWERMTGQKATQSGTGKTFEEVKAERQNGHNRTK